MAKMRKKLLKGALFKGLFGFLFYICLTILVPYFTFSAIRNVQVQNINIDIGMNQEEYLRIVFYIIAFGTLVSTTAFFRYSSPSQSIRKAVFALLQVNLNCLYAFSYKFSGATEINFTLIGYGFMTLIVENMVMLYMGIYFLTIIIYFYDLIDFTINRNKIRAQREG